MPEPSQPGNATSGPHFRVLVVDDNIDAADTLAAVLDMMGHAAQVARALRQIPAGTHVVLIALTGWGAENDRSQSSAAGFDHHLTKPASLLAIGELLATLSTPKTPTENHD